MTSLVIERTLRCSNSFLRPSPKALLRPFSTSLRIQGPNVLPTFKPTSSPELDKELATFYDEVFVPSHLPQKLRKVVFGKTLIDAETPLIVEIGGKQVQLKPLSGNVMTKKGAVTKIITLMRSPGDLDILPEFVEALHNAKPKAHYVLTAPQVQFIISACRTYGRMSVAIELFRRHARTGMRLGNVGIVRGLLFAIRQSAWDSDWNAEATAKAMRDTQTVVDMMAEDAHRPKKPGVVNPRTLPEIGGFLLELAAVSAVKHGGSAIDVETHLKRVHGMWPNWTQGKLVDRNARPSPDPVRSTNSYLYYRIPVWNGLRVAEQVEGLGEEALGIVKELLPQAEKRVEEAKAIAEEAKEADERPEADRPVFTYDGLKWYKKIMGQ